MRIHSPKFQNAFKTLSIAMLMFVAFGLPFASARAQDANAPLTLDDASPSIDAVLTPANGASGVVSIEMDSAQIRLSDTAQNEVLSLADNRVTMLSFQFAQGAAPHVLHVERLPGVKTAQVKISALTELPVVQAVPTNGTLVSLTGPISGKAAVAPAVSLPVSVSDAANMVTLSLPATPGTFQLVDTKGSVLIQSRVAPAINGMSVRVASGNYLLNVTNADLKAASEIQVSLSPAPALSFTPTASPAAVTPGTATACTLAVKGASVNMRSGPGTAYSITGFITKNDKPVVGGSNKEGGWVLVQTATGTGWVSGQLVDIQGNCAGLTIYDIPLKNANVQPPVIRPGTSVQPTKPSGEHSGGDDHGKDDDHGGDDHGGKDD